MANTHDRASVRTAARQPRAPYDVCVSCLRVCVLLIRKRHNTDTERARVAWFKTMTMMVVVVVIELKTKMLGIDSIGCVVLTLWSPYAILYTLYTIGSEFVGVFGMRFRMLAYDDLTFFVNNRKQQLSRVCACCVNRLDIDKYRWYFVVCFVGHIVQ